MSHVDSSPATMFDLSGKTAVVTGAGSGIGRCIAETFARRGAHVEVLDIGQDLAAQAAHAIQQSGGSAAWRTCDVGELEQVRKQIGDILDEAGRIDILVNSAAIAHVGNLLSSRPDDLDAVYRVNVKGVYHCSQACVGPMIEAGGGVILNLASIASLVALKDRFAYSMSKGAVLTMTYSIAVDYLEHNIRCNCICPARVHTPFVDGFVRKNYPGQEKEAMDRLSAAQPIGRMAKPEEVAALALYLCSDEASFATGCAYPIDGGVLHLRA